MLLLCNNEDVKKKVEIDIRAGKELKNFPKEVQARFVAMFTILERDGYLHLPYGKRINTKLFEIRIKYQGQWRSLYAYLDKFWVIILSAFLKKTQKTPIKEIKKALNRLKQYQEVI